MGDAEVRLQALEQSEDCQDAAHARSHEDDPQTELRTGVIDDGSRDCDCFFDCAVAAQPVRETVAETINGENVVPTSGEETAEQKVEVRVRPSPRLKDAGRLGTRAAMGITVHAQTVVVQPHLFDCIEPALERRCTSDKFGQPRAPEDHVAYGDRQPCF